MIYLAVLIKPKWLYQLIEFYSKFLYRKPIYLHIKFSCSDIITGHVSCERKFWGKLHSAITFSFPGPPLPLLLQDILFKRVNQAWPDKRLIINIQACMHLCRKCDFLHSMIPRHVAHIHIHTQAIKWVCARWWLAAAKMVARSAHSSETAGDYRILVGLETCRRVTHFEIVLKKVVYLLRQQPFL